MPGYIGNAPGITSFDLNDITDVNAPTPVHGDSILYDSASAKYINTQIRPTVAGVIDAVGRLSGGNDVSVGYLEATSDANERRTVNVPAMTIDIGGSQYTSTTALQLNLNTQGSWDDYDNAGYVGADVTQTTSRAGKDFYVYACVPASGTVPNFVLSNNATVPYAIPSGATPTISNTRKIGGFHCLCVNVGTNHVPVHELAGYLIGDILPRSVWDNHSHRPESPPEGMVYVGNRLWADIYLASNPGGVLETKYDQAPIAGANYGATPTPYYHWYNFAERFAEINKRLPTQAEFMALAIGSNEEQNIAGDTFSAKTTGGHVDELNRRMISNIGCEDCCGALWQWLNETGATVVAAGPSVQDTDGSPNSYDEFAGIGRGQAYSFPTRGRAGGYWGDGARCGSRGVAWNGSPLSLGVSLGARGVSASLY